MDTYETESTVIAHSIRAGTKTFIKSTKPERIRFTHGGASEELAFIGRA
jgi:hypothetical protein